MRDLLISMVANFLFWWTKQIFFLFIKLEPLILSWLQPKKSNFVPTGVDASISYEIQIVNFFTIVHNTLFYFILTKFISIPDIHSYINQYCYIG